VRSMGGGGFAEADFDQVADFVHRAIKITGGCRVGVGSVMEGSGCSDMA
jgi:hypothetical protein